MGPDGKELPTGDDGKYVNPDAGTQKFDLTTTESTDDPLTDEAGNPVEAGTIEALLRRVKEHFDGEDNVEVLRVAVQEIKTVKDISGAELAEVK